MNRLHLIILIAGSVLLIKPVHPLTEFYTSNSADVEIISVEGLAELINNRDGKPLLINIWATWCAPCREEFPDLVEIANEYEDKIDVVGISVDFPGEIDSKIIPFLNKQNADFKNYVIRVIEPAYFIDLLNKKWSGAIPATFLYDEKGNQIDYSIGKQSLEDFRQIVERI